MKTQWEKFHHCHNLSVQSRNATSVVSCLAPTWLQINKMSPITRSMVPHTNPEDCVSLVQPPAIFITNLSLTFSNLPTPEGISSFKAMFSSSFYFLHFSAFTEESLPVDLVFLE